MLKLQNVSKYYSRNGAVALGLRKVNLELGLGEFVAVVGESGSGKSTLLHVMCGLDTYEDGELYIGGAETSHYTAQDWENYRRTYVGFVSQNFNLIDSYTVLQNVEAALILAGYDPAKRLERALQIIERVGLTPHAHMRASKLSGGQMQRTVIARALAKDCPIIAADEPTGNLDSASSQQIIELLQEISRDKLVIVVTHNFAEVAHLATRKVTIHDGEVVENRQLKPAAPAPSAPASVAKTSQVSWREALLMAVRNLGSTPLKTLLMFLVMLLLTFGSSFVYGSMRNLQDETAFKSGSPYFRNSMEQRVIVGRSDNGAMTADELEALAAIPNVAALVQGDLALDQPVNASYPKALGDGHVDVSALVMPGALVEEAKLTAGRRPETAAEVAINTRILRRGVAAEDLLGRTFEYTAKSTKFSLTIVGISEDRELGEVVFAHREILDQIAAGAVSQYQTFTYSAGPFQGIPFTPVLNEGSRQLGENEVGLPMSMANSYCSMSQIPMANCLAQIIGSKVQLTAASLYESDTAEFTVAEVVAQTQALSPPQARQMNAAPPIYVGQATLDRWTDRHAVYQVSVMTRTADQARTLLPLLAGRGYKTFYPFDTLDSISYLIRTLQWILLGVLLVLFIGVFFFITYFIMRTVMRSKRKDYVTLRSIGATQPFIRQTVLYELFVLSTLTYGVALLLFGVSRVVSVPVVSRALANMFRSYGTLDYLYIYALIAVMTVLLTRRFHRTLLGDSVVSAFKGEEGEQG